MQFQVSAGSVLLTAAVGYFCMPYIGYQTIALLLLVTVSISAMLFDILPVLLAAFLSALIWNFFFIPPLFTFHIDRTEDLLMFLLYFFIAMVNAVLTLKIRRQERKVRDKEEKENTIKLYNTLINSLSHELKTPISTIIGAIDALIDQREKISKSNQFELLSQIEIAGTRLNRQVENLLNMSRLETGMLKPNMDWCDASEMIHNVIQNLGIPYRQTLIFQPDEVLPLFKFDRGLLEQVIQNLIHNAVFYTPDQAIVSIKVRHHKNNCIITVSDNGKGIPEEEIERVFERFYRSPGVTTGGSGLGLSIVKGFVEAHGGKVKLENNENGGATFSLEIPAQVSYLSHE